MDEGTRNEMLFVFSGSSHDISTCGTSIVLMAMPFCKTQPCVCSWKPELASINYFQMPVQFSYLGKGNCTNKTCGLNTGINPHDRMTQLEDKVAQMIAAFKDCKDHITHVICMSHVV
jgi:hypothetical protein